MIVSGKSNDESFICGIYIMRIRYLMRLAGLQFFQLEMTSCELLSIKYLRRKVAYILFLYSMY